MNAKIFLSISLLSLILLPVLSCKKSTSCGTEIICASIDGATFAGNTYTPGYNQYWQQGSYAAYMDSTGTLTLVAGNFSLQSSLLLNILTRTSANTVYSPAKGNMTCVYATPNSSTPNLIPIYSWKDSTSNGTLVLSTFDTINNLVSGTFTGLTLDAEYGQSPSTQSVTNGTFTDVPLIKM